MTRFGIFVVVGSLFVIGGAVTLLRMQIRAPSPSLGRIYNNSSHNFSLHLPLGYAIDESYRYQERGPGKDIAGVKFTIPASVATGTNLAPDSYISVEDLPQATNCTADLFLDGALAHDITESDGSYTIASSTGAGAGNRYEETVYALSDTNPCVAVRYFIHYGVIDNYPSGAVREFDRAALLAGFDAIRHSLVFP